MASWGIGLVAVVVALLVAYGLRQHRRALGVFVLWVIVTGGLALAGVFARFDARPPPLAFLLLGSIAIGLGLSRFARDVPLVALVGLQSFRLPLEIFMHDAARTGVMPPQMSYAGYNFDIVTGITAIIVAVLIARNRAPLWLVRLWNLMGLALVLIVMSIAVASTPVFHAFGTDPAHVNTFIAYFPYQWLPAILVATAVGSHAQIAHRLAKPLVTPLGNPTPRARN